jgi:hypothetical protein
MTKHGSSSEQLTARIANTEGQVENGRKATMRSKEE